MQSTEKRVFALETAKGKCRPLEHLTDDELDERIEYYRMRISTEHAAIKGADDANH